MTCITGVKLNVIVIFLGWNMFQLEKCWIIVLANIILWENGFIVLYHFTSVWTSFSIFVIAMFMTNFIIHYFNKKRKKYEQG